MPHALPDVTHLLSSSTRVRKQRMHVRCDLGATVMLAVLPAAGGAVPQPRAKPETYKAVFDRTDQPPFLGNSPYRER